ncbi:MAG: metallophosphoesterase family protein [Candidatus Diapherotrites archaeon]|nr:metallophosphoesterase family protein [Candidatus Diapherotrites archaeon]
MRILAISDIHSNINKVRALRRRFNGEIDLVVFSGDITNECSIEVAKDILKELSFAKVFVVPGNMDDELILNLFEKEGVCLHKKVESYNGYSFIGLGGAKPINTLYKLNLSELEAKKYLKKLSLGLDSKKTIIVTHSPPYNTRISKTYSNVDLGLKELRSFIENFQPLVVLSGHVHEAKGFDNIGKTICINPGPLKDGNFCLLNISDKGVFFESGLIE